jgi:hypothetical protein
MCVNSGSARDASANGRKNGQVVYNKKKVALWQSLILISCLLSSMELK